MSASARRAAIGALRRLGARASLPAGSPASISICSRCGAIGMLQNPTPRSKTFSTSSILYQGRDRLPVDPGHQAADARVRPDRLASRPCRMDRGEVPRLDRQRRQSGDAVSRDEMLANISLYWFTGAIGSSFWPYYARMHGPGRYLRVRPSRCRQAMPNFPRRSCARRVRWRRLHRHPALDCDAEGRALRCA